MRRRTVMLGIVVAAVFLYIASMGEASAQTFRTGDNVAIGPNGRIDSTLFAAGPHIGIKKYWRLPIYDTKTPATCG